MTFCQCDILVQLSIIWNLRKNLAFLGPFARLVQTMLGNWSYIFYGMFVLHVGKKLHFTLLQTWDHQTWRIGAYTPQGHRDWVLRAKITNLGAMRRSSNYFWSHRMWVVKDANEWSACTCAFACLPSSRKWSCGMLYWYSHPFYRRKASTWMKKVRDARWIQSPCLRLWPRIIDLASLTTYHSQDYTVGYPQSSELFHTWYSMEFMQESKVWSRVHHVNSNRNKITEPLTVCCPPMTWGLLLDSDWCISNCIDWKCGCWVPSSPAFAAFAELFGFLVWLCFL